MREALRLNATDRASMAHELLNSLETLSEAEIEQLWVEEALRRSAEIDAGTVETLPADEVIVEAGFARSRTYPEASRPVAAHVRKLVLARFPHTLVHEVRDASS